MAAAAAAEARAQVALPEGKYDRLYTLAVLLVFALAAHFQLSALGFNLTDDGFVLAQSRRLLSGELPHRDFISIRPVGSALIHVVDLLIGGEHTFLMSRLLYWLSVAFGCWAWLTVVLESLPVRLGRLAVLPFAALAFMFSTHTFPPMAWYTADAITLASLGLMASGSQRRSKQLMGHALIGAAAICKQNFLPLAVLGVLLRGRARQPQAWLAAFAAPLAYVAVLAACGAGADMQAQLTAVTGLYESGLKPYVQDGWFAAGVALGALVGWLATRTQQRGANVLRYAAVVVGWGAVVFAGRALDVDGFRFILSEAFLILGLATGALLVQLVRRDFTPAVVAAVFALGLAWCSAVSLGYRSPAFACGPLLLVFGLGTLTSVEAKGRTNALRMATACATLALLLVAPHWWSARRDHIYHEATEPLLTHDLGGVLPGGAGIRTNENTYAMLKDLHDTVDSLRGRRYALLVDGPGWWVCAEQRNPLPLDWANNMELPTEALSARVTGRMLAQRGELAVIVQRSTGLRSSIGFRPVPLDDPFYGMVVSAMRTLEPVSGSLYWVVCR